jgi:hypothetical protein
MSPARKHFPLQNFLLSTLHYHRRSRIFGRPNSSERREAGHGLVIAEKKFWLFRETVPFSMFGEFIISVFHAIKPTSTKESHFQLGIGQLE